MALFFSKSMNMFSFRTKARTGWPSLSRVALVFSLVPWLVCLAAPGATGKQARLRISRLELYTPMPLHAEDSWHTLILRQTHHRSKVTERWCCSKKLPVPSPCLTCLPCVRPSLLATCCTRACLSAQRQRMYKPPTHTRGSIVTDKQAGRQTHTLTERGRHTPNRLSQSLLVMVQ